MKYKKYVLFVLLSIPVISCSMDKMIVSVPSRGVLQKRMNEIEMGNFISKTDFLDICDKEQVSLAQVTKAVEAAVKSYEQFLEKNLQDPRVNLEAFGFSRNKQFIYGMLLCDYPQAIKMLEDTNNRK